MSNPGLRDAFRRRVAELCLELPEAVEEHTGGHAAYLVVRRKFAYLLDDHHGDGRLGLCVRSPDGIPADPHSAFYSPAYIGPRGWIGLDLTAGPVDWTDAAGLIVRSFLVVAPKRLAAQIGQPPGP